MSRAHADVQQLFGPLGEIYFIHIIILFIISECKKVEVDFKPGYPCLEKTSKIRTYSI